MKKVTAVMLRAITKILMKQAEAIDIPKARRSQSDNDLQEKCPQQKEQREQVPKVGTS